MNYGDRVTHPDYPGETGTINRIVFSRHPRPWFRVTWPSGDGRDELYRESELFRV